MYFMQVFGMLPTPYVWISWSMEYLNTNLFGTTARASEFRTILSFTVNIASVLLIYWIHHEPQLKGYLITVALAYINSQNYMGSLFLRQPLSAPNQRLAVQNKQAEFVFQGKHSADKTKQ